MHVSDRIALNHLDRMTDSTGLIQHAIYSIPRRESGYTTDDNARALRLCTRLWEQQPGERMLGRVTTYLSFLEHARCPVRGFHNFLSYQRDWLDAEGTGDSQGQAVRALAEVLGSSLPDGYRELARELIDAVTPALADLRSLRAQAYVILAWGHLSMSGVKDLEPVENVAWSAAQRLVECYHRSQRPDWPWFESRMTYANAVLPHALFVAARCWPEEDFLDVAEASFAFLDRETTVEERLLAGRKQRLVSPRRRKIAVRSAAGRGRHDGRSRAGRIRAAGRCGDEKYLAAFRRAHAWFHGQNSLHQPLVDVHCGSCYDGLQRSGVNRNQGAESTLAYLWAELNNKDNATCVENRKPLINTRSCSIATPTTPS